MTKRKKERPGLPRRYTFKLAPTPAQEAAMLEQCRMIAQLWNALLEMNERGYQRISGHKGVVHKGEGRFNKAGRWAPAEKTMFTHFDMLKDITECPEWRQLSTWTGNRVAFALEQAFKGFFRRAREGAGASSGYPKYRSVRKANWIPHIFYSGIKMRPSSGSSQTKWRLELPSVQLRHPSDEGIVVALGLRRHRAAPRGRERGRRGPFRPDRHFCRGQWRSAAAAGFRRHHETSGAAGRAQERA
jgi:hypothetical protein